MHFHTTRGSSVNRKDTEIKILLNVIKRGDCGVESVGRDLGFNTIKFTYGRPA